MPQDTIVEIVLLFFYRFLFVVAFIFEKTRPTKNFAKHFVLMLFRLMDPMIFTKSFYRWQTIEKLKCLIESILIHNFSNKVQCIY